MLCIITQSLYVIRNCTGSQCSWTLISRESGQIIIYIAFNNLYFIARFIVGLAYMFVHNVVVPFREFYFYSASALLAMQTAVLARGILSVCLSVRQAHSSVLSRGMNIRSCGIQHLVSNPSSFWSGEVKFIRIFAGDHARRGGVKVRQSQVDSENLTNNRP